MNYIELKEEVKKMIKEGIALHGIAKEVAFEIALEEMEN